MSAFLFYGVAASLGLWITLLLLPWQPWRTRETLDAPGATPDADLSEICVLIPARNEARLIGRTLHALAAQGRNLRIVVIDDGSEDGTAGTVECLELPDLTLVHAEALPQGWSGKLWALEQGRRLVDRPLILLLDADIELQPGILAALRDKLHRDDLGMVSLMAWLRMETVWEKLLVPAFIFFFRLLYPFAWANSRLPGVAAAAGGCVLVKRAVLDGIGGFASLRDALIDDCTLAARIKSAGHRGWIGLTHSARSLRQADGLRPLWDMVARSAFTQLRYSSLLLVLVTSVMLLAFALPPAALALGDPHARLAGVAALLAMAVAYLPTLTYYGRSRGWALLLPVTGLLYLAMTWTSAIRYWRGERSRWKGRSYRTDNGHAS